MIKVSFDKKRCCGEIKEVHTKENKVTIVTIRGQLIVPEEAKMILFKYKSQLDKDRKAGIKIYQDIYDCFMIEAKGKSVRNDEDENNAKKAKWIAESRAKAKIYKACEHISREAHKELKQKLEKYEQSTLKYRKLEIKENIHVYELVNGIN